MEKAEGFMVSFERKEGPFLAGGHFPDKHRGEPLIPTEDEAWNLAKEFAAKNVGRCVNVYVVSHDFIDHAQQGGSRQEPALREVGIPGLQAGEDVKPVPGYEAREIKNRIRSPMATITACHR